MLHNFLHKPIRDTPETKYPRFHFSQYGPVGELEAGGKPSTWLPPGEPEEEEHKP